MSATSGSRAAEALPAAGRGGLALYALPALPLAALTLPVFVHLPAFYGDTLGLGLAVVGPILLAARLFDVATDPLIGWLSDRTPAALGRRRLWMAAGTPLLALAAWELLRPPMGADAGHLLVWSLLLYLGWTMVSLPYQAWGAELSGNYHERTRIAGWREAATVLGTIAAAALPAVWADGPSEALAAIAIGVVVLLPLSVALCLIGVREPTRQPVARTGAASIRLVVDNRPFRRLISAYLLNGLANGLPATLFVLFVAHRLGAPETAGPLLLLYFVAGLASIPVWLRVSSLLGKHRAWCLAMLGACAGFAAVPFLDTGDAPVFALVCLLTGLMLGADLALPGAIQADVVDVDSAAGGGGRAGLYFALWGMATKLALALAVGIAFPLLGWAGFAAGADGQPAEALTMLAMLYGLAPLPFKLAAVAVMWRFPLTEPVQRELRRRIAGETADDPNMAPVPAPSPPRPPLRGMQPHET